MPAGISIVTGGLGYIGQSLAAYLSDLGESPVIVDRRTIPSQVAGIPVVRGDVGDSKTWESFVGQPIRCVFHCAGLIQVAESVKEPARYFNDNIVAGLNMLRHLGELDPVPVIFSSSAAVYGAPDATLISEETDLNPMSPYGVTKRQFEEILAAYWMAYGSPRYVALRYFNAAGRYADVMENHQPETHLLPRFLSAAESGESPVIYGSDYATPDGTAIRDYVHIQDLVRAHVAALEYLEEGGRATRFNVGAGRGVSVLEVFQAIKEQIPGVADPQFEARRPGDPPVLVADITKARKELRWTPEASDIGQIVADLVAKPQWGRSLNPHPHG